MKSRAKIIDRILEEIRSHHSFCVVGHIRPDGDCIGSQIALTLALKNQRKKVVCWNQDAVPQKLAFLDPQGLVQQPKPGRKFDCVIALDASNLDRIGSVGECIAERKSLINIDHHPSNDRFGDINWVSQRSPSTGELVFRIMKAARWTINPRIAECLFTAISTDTGSFQYPTTLPETYVAAGELLKRGADLAKICDEVYQSYPLSRVKLLKHMYNHFKLTEDNQIAYVWLKLKDYARAGAEPNDTEGLIDHIRDIEPVVVAVVFEELEGNITRVSLRSKHPRINVGEIATNFTGGGHQAAAGARMEGTPLSVQRKVVKEVKKAIKSLKSK